MYSGEFDYYRAKNVAEAAALLRKHKNSKLLAGGHSLLPAMRLRLASPSALVDIGGIRALSGIKARGKSLEIGSMTTHGEIAASQAVRKACPVLAEAAAEIGDAQVRNRGTIGGSLAHADPGADYPTVLLALGATLTAVGPKGKREIAVQKFFLDLFTTALKAGEILTTIRVSGYGAGAGGSYVKHRHPASSFAVVGVAAVLAVEEGKCGDVRIAVGGATSNPVRATAAEQALDGRRPDASSIAAAAARVAEAIVDPMGDLYASGEYRTHLATVLAKRALTTAIARARE
ncbi:MAG TPA: xanthine dehydrogenase family protein subunit M [Thermoanaerobaculia bacterium]